MNSSKSLYPESFNKSNSFVKRKESSLSLNLAISLEASSKEKVQKIKNEVEFSTLGGEEGGQPGPFFTFLFFLFFMLQIAKNFRR